MLSCSKDPLPQMNFTKTEGVFIINEGNFTYGNASLSFLDLSTQEIENQVFFKANGFPLGDVAYSMTIQDSTAFIVVNNSGKIFAMNTHTFRHEGTLAGLVSPRQVHLIDHYTGYISDLYSPYVLQFNPQTLAVTDTIQLGQSSEQMIHLGDFLYVASWSFGHEVFKISMISNQLVGSVEVARQPNSLVLDKNDQLWILSDGGFEGSSLGYEHPTLAQIDPKSMEIRHNLVFPDLQSSPNHLCINANQDSLFFLNSSWAGESEVAGIYTMSITDLALPSQPLIPSMHRRFYGLGVDPETTTIYVSDAQDYLQRGYVYRFLPDGKSIDSLQVDRIPGSFSFISR